MNDMINSLRDALLLSPDNIPLRTLLAENLLSLEMLDQAEEQYNILVRTTSSVKSKVGLATVFYKKNKYSACNVILEQLMEEDDMNLDVLTLYAKGLLKENEMARAVEIYNRVLILDPQYYDEELDSNLKLKATEYIAGWEDGSDNRFLEKPLIKFDDVGGMDAVKKEIDLKIIKPLLHPDLYKAYGKKIGGGILLYGPPGCGKTYLAKATAGQINARFIDVGLNDILDMWIGNSEKNLHGMFELARANNPSVLFIDEIDALGASRSDMKQSSGRHLINQFLHELDGVSSDNEGILVLGATNTPWNLDPAFRRPGRFDRIIFVPPPDEGTREAILKLKLKNKPVGSMDYRQIAAKTNHYSGADIDAIIDLAIEDKLTAAFEEGIPQPIETKDLLLAIKKHKPSTQEWFATAKNFALFANDTGLYDDILAYLKIKK